MKVHLDFSVFIGDINSYTNYGQGSGEVSFSQVPRHNELIILHAPPPGPIFSAFALPALRVQTVFLFPNRKSDELNALCGLEDLYIPSRAAAVQLAQYLEKYLTIYLDEHLIDLAKE